MTHPLTALLLLSILAATIYSNTFSASFQFDDHHFIVENPKIKHLANLLDPSGSRYVAILSFALNYHFGQLNVFGYHLVNLLIHIANGFLIYSLVRLLFRASHTPLLTPHDLRLTPASWIGLATALLFVAHPIQTMAVTYITQRFASMAALFYLLTVVCYLLWRLSPLETKSRHLWYAAAFLATILAMKTKENTFTLPFMLLGVEIVFFGPLTRRQWIGLIPFLLMLSIIPLSRLEVEGDYLRGESEVGLTHQTTEIGRFDYLVTQFRVIVTYLRLLVFPVHQNLDYDYPVYHSLFDPPVLFSFLFLFALLALAIYLLFSSRLSPPASRPLTSSASPHLRRVMAFGILWFFLTLSIESSFIPLSDVIWEYRLYLPSIGFWLTVCVAALGISDRWRVPRIIAVGLVIVVFAGVAYQRNKVWKDEFTLWSDVVRKSPQKGRGHNNLGLAYADRKNWKEAIQEYKTALTIESDYEKAHNNLGLAYSALERYGEAIQEYKTALTLKPDYAAAHSNLGLLYYNQKKLPDALFEFEQAVKFSPDNAGAHTNLGNVYQESGRLAEALREYQTAIGLSPDYAEAYYKSGLIYYKQQRLSDAVSAFERVIELKPDQAEPHYWLGNVYKEQGRPDEAIREYQAATTLKPDYFEAHYSLAAVYKNLGRLNEAIQEYQAALALNQGYPEAHNNLGNIYQVQGHLDEAIREYQTATTLKPDYTVAHYNLGIVYYARGQISDALLAFQKSIQLKPDFAEAHNNLGYVYFGLGRMTEAVREYEIAVKLKPDLAEAYFNLGQAYQRMGQTQEAIHALERAIQIKPDYEMARQALNSLRP